MKRGLVRAADRDAVVYESRLDLVRRRLRDNGCDAGLIYGDVFRSDDIAHLTNLCIYWNEGTIAVPVDAPPAFLAKLSARVHPWMRRTSVIEDLRASQRLPELIAGYLNEIGASKVALIDRDWWPFELVDGIAAATDGITFVALPDAVRMARKAPDARDSEDLEVAATLAAQALGAATAVRGENDAARLATIERTARGAGARDVIAGCSGVAGAVQLEVTVQYSNVWAHAARVLPSAGDRLTAAAESARAALRPGITPAALAEAIAPELDVSLTYHCDLATAGDYRPASDLLDPVPAGAVVSLAVSDGIRKLADTVRVDTGEAAVLTATVAEVRA